MFRFTIRDVLWLTALMAMGVGWWAHYRNVLEPPKLYRDEEVASLYQYIVPSANWADEPAFLVVAPGDQQPRSKVFQKLGIEDRRLLNFRGHASNNGCTLVWQISPSYDIVCFSSGDVSAGLAFDNPKRMVFGVHLQKREERPQP